MMQRVLRFVGTTSRIGLCSGSTTVAAGRRRVGGISHRLSSTNTVALMSIQQGGTIYLDLVNAKEAVLKITSAWQVSKSLFIFLSFLLWCYTLCLSLLSFLPFFLSFFPILIHCSLLLPSFLPSFLLRALTLTNIYDRTIAR